MSKRNRTGEGAKVPPKKMWILLDVSNGHYPTTNYMWWFKTKKEALEKKKEHDDIRLGHRPQLAKLIGPFKYKLL
jgi:hypothetical protein